MEFKGGSVILWPVLFLSLVSSLLPAVRSEKNLQYYLNEEQPPKTFIANILLDAQLDKMYSDDDLRLLKFSLHDRSQSNQNFRHYFSVDRSSGVLYTAERIDREVLCPHKTNCPLHLNIMVQPGEFFQIIKVTIHILDLNDNIPVFPNQMIAREISENARVGASIALPLADDLDATIFGIQSYDSVGQSNDIFDISYSNTSDGLVDLHLVLKERVDREEKDAYIIEVIAVDGGSPPKSGSMMVRVVVQDANDNNPKFDNFTYEVTISENTPIGSTIIQIHAHDPDDGVNGKIEYKFADSTSSEHGNLFGIDIDTGDIYILGHIDFESGSLYYLTVTAQDKGPNSLPAYAKVVVRVRDVNDHAPHITINALTNTGYVEVSEDAPIGTFVAHVSVVDHDSGDSGKFNCTMKDDNFNLEKLYASEFKITTARIFDRESNLEYNLNIICRDGGNPPNTETQPISVTIMDANDHAPRFQHKEFDVKFRENNAIGSFLTQVVATDRDVGINAEIRYSVIDNRNIISIDETTGIVRAQYVFDYESQSLWEFIIEARDHGEPQQSSRMRLRLLIQDDNDMKPTFKNSYYTFNVTENKPAGTHVGFVTATDQDSNPYNIITYMLDPDYDLRSFAVDRKTGEITTKKELNREDGERISLVVIAKNEGFTLMQSQANVTIMIDDVNDNVPILDFPNEWNNTVQISKNAAIGNRVTQIKAHDLDKGVNAELMYYFFDGNSKNFFRIDNMTGVIYLNKLLDREDEEGYQISKLKVMVRDQGENQLEAMGDLSIVVNKTIAKVQYQNASGFTSFFRIHDIHVIIGIIVVCFVVVVLTLTIIIVKCRRSSTKHTTRNGKYKGRRDSKKRGSSSSGNDVRDNLEWKAIPDNDWSNTDIVIGKDGKQKKAVTFRMEVEEGSMEDGKAQLWPPNMTTDTERSRYCKDSDATTDEDTFSTLDREKPFLAGGNVRHFAQPEPGDGGGDGRHPVANHASPTPPPPHQANQLSASANHHPHHHHPPHHHHHHHHHPNYSGSKGHYAPLTKAELEMHEMLQFYHGDGDSETGSYTDSGRGPSEEGDMGNHNHHGNHGNSNGGQSSNNNNPGLGHRNISHEGKNADQGPWQLRQPLNSSRANGGTMRSFLPPSASTPRSNAHSTSPSASSTNTLPLSSSSFSTSPRTPLLHSTSLTSSPSPSKTLPSSQTLPRHYPSCLKTGSASNINSSANHKDPLWMPQPSPSHSNSSSSSNLERRAMALNRSPPSKSGSKPASLSGIGVALVSSPNSTSIPNNKAYSSTLSPRGSLKSSTRTSQTNLNGDSKDYVLLAARYNSTPKETNVDSISQGPDLIMENQSKLSSPLSRDVTV